MLRFEFQDIAYQWVFRADFPVGLRTEEIVADIQRTVCVIMAPSDLAQLSYSPLEILQSASLKLSSYVTQTDLWDSIWLTAATIVFKAQTP